MNSNSDNLQETDSLCNGLTQYLNECEYAVTLGRDKSKLKRWERKDLKYINSMQESVNKLCNKEE